MKKIKRLIFLVFFITTIIRSELEQKTLSEDTNAPLYNIEKTFQENFDDGFNFIEKPPQRVMPSQTEWKSLFGYKIASSIGVPACAIMNSKGIAYLSKLGFDILTYKTIRSTPFPSHSFPNICYVLSGSQLNSEDLGKSILQTPHAPIHYSDIAISNSFGNGSFDIETIQIDIKKARKSLMDGQILIVSVFGEEHQDLSIIDDFAYTAQLAQKAGAHVIELNFSCPNIKSRHPIYQDSELVYQICKKTSQTISIPFIIKVGFFDSEDFMKKIFIAASNGGAKGICGINSFPMRVLSDKNNSTYFGNERKISGISGSPIRSLALKFTQMAHKIIQQEKLDLIIFATGGITKPEHFDDFLNTGATIAMSGTGTMWNPYLAMNYHNKKNG